MPCPLIRHPPAQQFAPALRRLTHRFSLYAATSPQPLPAPGLIITPEIRRQSELYLPLDELRPVFYRYYRASLRYPPILVSTPFHQGLSWADCFAELLPLFHISPDPGRLLARLLADFELHEKFIFASFLPVRYNGAGFGRYPQQRDWLREKTSHPSHWSGEPLRCLDAACGSGEGCWELAELLQHNGWQPHQVQLDGWTRDPLEVYAATEWALPHLPQRQRLYRHRCAPLAQAGWQSRISFQVVDLMASAIPSRLYDLILCNGLLGGPLLHHPEALQSVIRRLSHVLRPGGWLLAADCFHAGWHKRVGRKELACLFKQAGLAVEPAGEGIAGQKSMRAEHSPAGCMQKGPGLIPGLWHEGQAD